MTFLPLSEDAEFTAEARAAAERRTPAHGGRISNTERTLLGHVPSFDAYLQWSALRDELEPYIGERAVALFAYAISDAAGSIVCATGFRRELVESGDDPDDPQVTETERLLLDWGRMIGADPRGISDGFRTRLEQAFQPKLRLILVAFAGLTVAMSVFTIVGQVPLDESLLPFRAADGDRDV